MSEATQGLERDLAAARTRLAASKALLAAIFDDNPDGVVVLYPDGTSRLNAKGEQIMRLLPGQAGDDHWQTEWGFFSMDGRRLTVPELGGFRAMQGETVDGELLRIVAPQAPEGFVIRSTARPTPGGGSITVFQEVTDQIRMERELEERAGQLAESDQENRALIERLRSAIEETATPVLRIADDVLVMPIIGVLDGARSTRSAERLLSEVSKARARFVIVDVTGVELIDTATADLFSRVTRAVRLLGARAIVSGMQPNVARTLAEVGLSMDDLPTHRSLRHALQSCLQSKKPNAKPNGNGGVQ